MKKQITVLMMAVIALILTSCGHLTSDGRVDAAKNKLTTQITTESRGALLLNSFTKTNGTEQNFEGMQVYQLEFSAIISAPRACIKPGNAFTGYFDNFQVVLNEPTDTWERQNLSNAMRIRSGQHIELTGTVGLVKKDNGWEADQITIKTYRLI